MDIALYVEQFYLENDSLEPMPRWNSVGLFGRSQLGPSEWNAAVGRMAHGASLIGGWLLLLYSSMILRNPRCV